jgi:hypothetical protein
MSSTALLVGVVIVIGTVLILGVFTVVAGRGPNTGLFSLSGLVHQAPVKKPTRRRGNAEIPPAESPPDPLLDREPVTANEYALTRRRFFNRALFAVFGLFLAQFALASLASLWPKLKGGFGTSFNAGKVGDLKAEIIQADTVVPKFFPGAQAWVVPFELGLLPESSYEGVPFVVTGGDDDGITQGCTT